ncbi:hypothetical protein LCGC14_0362290 [marine sediment metagenome]|uniref:Uncharacterized protein n=1 Tax=marine sediment metagenome TaxID=412755 RepID=A0A0F9VUV0_9ZZZZ
MSRTPANPNHKSPFVIEGYKDLGWQNGWTPIWDDTRETSKLVGYEGQDEFNACKKAEHKKRDVDNSSHLFRGTDNIVICDECKHFSHYDCSD